MCSRAPDVDVQFGLPALHTGLDISPSSTVHVVLTYQFIDMFDV